MHPSRLALIVISIVGVITAFLPWQTLTVLGETINTKGVDTAIMFSTSQIGDGWFAITAFSLVIILALTGKRRLSVGLVKKVSVALLGIFCIYLTAFDSVQMKNMFKEIGSSPLAMQSKAGFGLYATLAISCLLAVVSFVPFKQKQV